MDERTEDTNQERRESGDTIGTLRIPRRQSAWEPADSEPARPIGPIVRRKTRRFKPAADAATVAASTTEARTGAGTAAQTADVGIPQIDAPPAQVKRTPRTSAKKELAKQQVSSLLNMLNHGAVSLVSPDAAMRDYEREMVEVPLWAYAETHTDTVGKAFDFAAPAVCITGVALWLRRVWKISGAAAPKASIPGRLPTPIRSGGINPESQRVSTAEAPEAPEPPHGRVLTFDDIRTMTEI